MKFNSPFIFVSLLVMALTGCSSIPSVSDTAAGVNKVKPESTVLVKPEPIAPLPAPSFQQVYRSWRGTPYRLGGNSKQGIDCSAFVQVGYSSVFNQLLPRTTGELAMLGKRVSLKDAAEGDLIFFKTGRRLRHVGIYLGNAEFLHASTSQGVMISTLANPYWRHTFWQVRRVRLL